MNWQKILVNTLASFVGSFAAAFGSGIPPREAAIAAGVATLTNIAGLFQKTPQQEKK